MAHVINYQRDELHDMSTKIAAVLFVLLLPAPAWARPPKGKPAPARVQPSPPPAIDREAVARRMEERIACLMEQTRQQSEVQHRTGQCEAKANDVRQCIARVRDRQSSNTGKGALIGLGAAVLTGGASLLFTGAGALIGHSASDEAPNECGNVPSCDGKTIGEAVARETGLRRRECPGL